MNINFSLCYWILLVCLQKNVSCCGSTETLTAHEGEDLILRVNQTLSQLSFITWNFEIQTIAITGPGRAIELGAYSDRYPGRLSSSNNGSLVITRLTAKDRQFYRAELFNKDWGYVCAQLFDVRTDGRDGPSPQINGFESCSSTKKIFRGLGQNVTLKLPHHSRAAEVAYAVWDINNINHIAITRPGSVLVSERDSYRGRVSAVEDGSLKLSNLITKDQQVYRAELFAEDWGYLCNQHYQVSVKSKDTKITIFKETYGLQNYIRLGLAACILVATLSILIYHIKTESSGTPQ